MSDRDAVDRGQAPKERSAARQQDRQATAKQPANHSSQTDSHPAATRRVDPQQRSSGQLLTQSVEPVIGAVVGAAAYVSAYVAIFALVLVDTDADVAGVAAEFGTSATTAVGWLFYGAHYTSLEVSAGTVLRNVNILSGSTLAIPKPVYFAVPVVLLVAAGYVLGRWTDARTSQETAVAGASVVVGYLPLMFVGSFLFRTVATQQSVDVVYGVSTATAVVMGAVMAVLLGSIGGSLAG